MPDSAKLSRTFSLRLSEHEYSRLKAACEEHGAHSLAELARNAMQQMIDAPPNTASSLDVRVTELHERVQELARTVDQFVTSTKESEDSEKS